MPAPRLSLAVVFVGGLLLTSVRVSAEKNQVGDFEERRVQAIERSLPLLETASAQSASKRKCFTCHGQAMPIVALTKARQRGFRIDEENFTRQVKHTSAHLKRSQPKYADGSGTGGQVDTAGWALWALEAADHDPDETTDAVVDYLLGKQRKTGVWKCSSNRPPSERSDFATTYLALRGLEFFAQEKHSQKLDGAKSKASTWFATADPGETEDRVFQLLTLPYVEQQDREQPLIDQLKRMQQDDGGWAQLPSADSDAYATATVLYALGESGIGDDDQVYRSGLEYLLQEQRSDGSWKVTSRSKPFQTYFETGYPHGADQFISTTAACWATIVLLDSLPRNVDEHH